MGKRVGKRVKWFVVLVFLLAAFIAGAIAYDSKQKAMAIYWQNYGENRVRDAIAEGIEVSNAINQRNALLVQGAAFLWILVPVGMIGVVIALILNRMGGGSRRGLR